MPLFPRSDGHLLKKLPHALRIQSIRSPRRSDSVAFIRQEFDITETIEFIRSYNQDPDRRPDQSISLFYLLACSWVRMLTRRPEMNRFISSSRFYQRREIRISFETRRTIADEPLMVSFSADPRAALPEIAGQIRSGIRETVAEPARPRRSNPIPIPHRLRKLGAVIFRAMDSANLIPPGAMRHDPDFSSVKIYTSGGTAPEAPLYPPENRGTCGITAVLGTMRKAWRFDEGGRKQRRDLVQLTIGYDRRIADDLYVEASIDLLRHLIQDPEPLLSSD
jgi:hypothetical protein